MVVPPRTPSTPISDSAVRSIRGFGSGAPESGLDGMNVNKPGDWLLPAASAYASRNRMVDAKPSRVKGDHVALAPGNHSPLSAGCNRALVMRAAEAFTMSRPGSSADCETTRLTERSIE